MAEVRAANVDDGPALGRIDLATWTSDVSPASAPEDHTNYCFFTERRTPGDVLVAEIDGLAVGWVMVHAATALPSNAHVLEIGGLAVAPSNQGIGVGRRLIEAAVQDCRDRGARKVTLRVLGPNAVARRLYERCGFHVEGILRQQFLLNGRYVDDVLMARPLTLPGQS